jgi:hypothetical protein
VLSTYGAGFEGLGRVKKAVGPFIGQKEDGSCEGGLVRNTPRLLTHTAPYHLEKMLRAAGAFGNYIYMYDKFLISAPPNLHLPSIQRTCCGNISAAIVKNPSER